MADDLQQLTRPGRIRKLPSHVANQIAAGEVIERPASVVKELLENAWDAGAGSVVIDIVAGGLSRIRVADDGCGILPEDLELAVCAHATSKLATLDDLDAIRSMGFRGEALASMASVSRMTITSRTAQCPHASSLVLDGENQVSAPAARVPGTTIEVCDLFHNAPVRKKFLKSARTEFDAIDALVKRFALAAFHMGITLKQDGKTVLDIPAHSDLPSRISRIWGQAFMQHALHVEGAHEGMQLSGWISAPHQQRSQNDRQWIFVNRRMVRDKLLLHALRQAYENRLHPGTHPSGLLWLEVADGTVDVNVHPVKQELRFGEPRLVHDFIVSVLRKALESAGNPEPVPQSRQSRLSPVGAPEPVPPAPTREDLRWVALNARFALVFAGDEPWWVDVGGVLAYHSAAVLRTAEKPMLSRPLLVPVRWEVNDGKAGERAEAALRDYGMELVRASQSHWLLRSLPVALPCLDVGMLATQFAQLPDVSGADLQALIASCQTVDARTMDERLREELGEVLYALFGAPSGSNTLCKKLTPAVCREILHA